MEYGVAWAKQNSEEITSLGQLCKCLGLAYRRDKSETLLVQWENLERRYPLLCCLRHNFIAVKDLFDYVNWVDRERLAGTAREA